MSGAVRLNTNNLREYAARIDRVNSRLVKIDARLKSLYYNVPVSELWSLIKVDAITGYSWNLRQCSGYLRETAGNFEAVERELSRNSNILEYKKVAAISFAPAKINSKKNILGNIGNAISKGTRHVYSTVANTVKKEIDSGKELIKIVKDEYNKHGTFYKAVEYGKCVMKGAIGVNKIVDGVVLIATGGGVPAGVLLIISGGNDVLNSVTNGAYIYTKQYDEVGKHNILKDTLSKNAGDLSEAMGYDREMGEKIGNGVYFGVDLATTLYAFDPQNQKSLVNQWKDAKTTDYKKLAVEMKDIGDVAKTTTVSSILTKDIGTIKYETALAKYEYAETTNMIKNAKLLYKTGETTISAADTIVSDMLGYDSKELEKMKEITGGVKKIGKVGKKIKQISNYID